MGNGKLKRVVDYLIEKNGVIARSKLSLKLGMPFMLISETDEDDEGQIESVIRAIKGDFELEVPDNILKGG